MEIKFRTYGNEDGVGLRVVVSGVYGVIAERREFYVYKDAEFKSNCEALREDAILDITKSINNKMGKVNEKLKSTLTFHTETYNEDGHKQVKIWCEYMGLYRQYVFVDFNNDMELKPEAFAQLQEQAFGILTWSIEKALNENGFNYEAKRSD